MSELGNGEAQRSTEDIADALVEQKKGISIVWLLPLLALAIGGWLVYKSFAEAKIPVQIEFATGEGIAEGKTEVRYKGFTIGVVDKLLLKPSLDGVIATVLFEREAKKALVEGTEFWLVKPEVSLAGVSGLDTLLSGNYISINPGTGKPAKHYVALNKAPPMSESTPGLHLTLFADALDSIVEGSPVLYRKLQVGTVTDYKLTADGNRVQIQIHVQPEYAHLVNKSTRFWNISGIDISGGLDGFHVDVGSVATLVAGGIAFAEPNHAASSEPAVDGDQFRLYENFTAAETGIPVTLYFSDASGILPGKTKIKFKGYELGTVDDMTFDSNMRGATVSASLDPKAQVAMFSDTKFWLVKPQLAVGAVKDLDAVFSGPYISVAPATTGEPTTHFVAIESAPPMKWDVPGLHLILQSESAASLERGAPIYYKNIQAGTVQDVQLQPDGKLVDITIHIRRKFSHLINDKTRFWHAGGLDLESNLQGIKLRSYSLVALLSGGLAFDTPLTKVPPKAVKNGHQYPLYLDYASAHADNMDTVIDKSLPGLYLVLETPEPGGLQIGAPVDYLHLPVGEVIGLELNDRNDGVRVHIRIEPRFKDLVKQESYFWRTGGIDVSGGLGGINIRTTSLASLLLGGVSFNTRPEYQQAAPATNGRVFKLAESFTLAHERGVEVAISFDDGAGIKVGTELKIDGMVVGRVKEVTLDEDFRGVNTKVLIEQYGEELAREGSQFWAVRPALGLVKTANLETLLTGVYLQAMPGHGAVQTAFKALVQPPQLHLHPEGLNIVIKTPRLNSLKAGDPVLYRQIPVGQVMGYELAETANHVRVFVNIQPLYAPLVRDNSIFWNASGIQVDAGLFSGVQINTESMETIMAGGIAFATPDQPGQQSVDGDSFMLRAELDDNWLSWSPSISLAKP